MRDHEVLIDVDGQRLRTPISYSIDIDMLQPADATSFRLPLDRATWDAAPLDAEYLVTIDGVPVCRGFVEEARDNGDGSFQVEGRDRVGRLVDESVPGAGFSIGDKRLSEVALEIVEPWYTKVAFSNAADRRLRGGEGKQSRAGREPALTAAQARAIGRRVEAGTSRWEALERLLRPLGLIAWGSADGDTLIIASPNYAQAPQYDFYEPLGTRGNVLSLSFKRSSSGRYALIEVSGSGRAPGALQPPFTPSFPGETRPQYVSLNRIGRAKDGPNADGTGRDFLSPKRLFVVSEALSIDEATREAHRTMARGLANARVIEVVAPGHGQLVEGAIAPTLFTPDTIATVYKEIEKGPGDDSAAVLVEDRFYVTRVRFSAARDQEQTELSLVPLGTELV